MNDIHYIFEILDTQIEHKTIADVVRIILFAKLHEKKVKAVFITKNKELQELTVNIISTIGEGFLKDYEKSPP
ncbi:hypothetical protein HYU40_03520 [Candidatus Woesearchaeota archaeon]|nr:hypothetical protein [Candidatus Woesearchaeota archaeon]